MDTYKNARLTPKAREEMVRVVEAELRRCRPQVQHHAEGSRPPAAQSGRWRSPRCCTVLTTPPSQSGAWRRPEPATASFATAQSRTAMAPPARRCVRTGTRAWVETCACTRRPAPGTAASACLTVR